MKLLWKGVFWGLPFSLLLFFNNVLNAQEPINFQELLDAGGEIIVPISGSPHQVPPLFLSSDTTIIFEEGAELKAIEEGFTGANDCLLYGGNIANITIIGQGSGGIMSMNKAEYTTGEWRHAFSCRSCQNVSITNMDIKDSGGDGIYLGRLTGVEDQASENWSLTNVRSSNNRRNNLSVIAVDGLTIDNSTFNGAVGTNPQGGIDFEPNNAGDYLKNIVVSNSSAEDNEVVGLLVSLEHLDTGSDPVDILISNFVASGKTYDVRVRDFTEEGPPNSVITLCNVTGVILDELSNDDTIIVYRCPPTISNVQFHGNVRIQ